MYMWYWNDKPTCMHGVFGNNDSTVTLLQMLQRAFRLLVICGGCLNHSAIYPAAVCADAALHCVPMCGMIFQVYCNQTAHPHGDFSHEGEGRVGRTQHI